MLMLIVILLQACSMTAPEKEMMDAFEQIAKYERNMAKQQAALVRLEREQTTLYNEIMSVGMKQFAKVAQLSKKAQMIIGKRRNQIEAEHQNMKRAKEKLQIVKEHASHLRDQASKQRVFHLIRVMERRYAAYEEVYVHYDMALTLEKELYRLFENENVTLKQLQAQTDKINDVYREMIAANERFNDYTEQYNQEKKRLFK
ncbi:YkyA family protein [Anoxybacteroides tepidamans]|uniref:YkyA family protein n=1 Tax=Anoxybacteroides tepidamans TaxID=265948 RepID=UPI0028A6B7A9|nr:YkyA family protein [Anoxybacillus tepidamans]